MLLNYTSSKVDIFSAHLIHNVDIEVLLIYSYTESSIQIMASLYINPRHVNGPNLVLNLCMSNIVIKAISRK